ncbi:MAG: DegV family EDD domain-containing protein [Thermomicrobiales bacterium]|nr:DegV family EDD domain-containing protein [Thermomicrobiales bacterium]
MSQIAIVTDSSADLDPRVAANAGITVVPVAGRLMVGEEQATTERSPRPAMVDDFAAAFAALAGTHDAIVAVLLSSRLGSVVAAAEEARARVAGPTRIELIDSRSASLGLGFQALRAAALARDGASVDDIATALRDATARHHVVFSIESLEHLRQSGQIGRSAALIADALQLKPLLRIDEGQIVPYERVRTRERAREELVDFVRDLPAVERCAVLYASDQEEAARLERAIAASTGLSPDRLGVARIGAAIADRVGPGALGVAVVEPDLR